MMEVDPADAEYSFRVIPSLGYPAKDPPSGDNLNTLITFPFGKFTLLLGLGGNFLPSLSLAIYLFIAISMEEQSKNIIKIQNY